MEQPVKITYRGLDPSDALNSLIHEEAAKLDKFFAGIVACRVAVERPEGHHRHGSPYRVGITIAVPGTELAVTTEPSDEIPGAHEDPSLSVRDAFRRAKRRLQDYAARKHDPHVRSGSG